MTCLLDLKPVHGRKTQRPEINTAASTRRLITDAEACSPRMISQHGHGCSPVDPDAGVVLIHSFIQPWFTHLQPFYCAGLPMMGSHLSPPKGNACFLRARHPRAPPPLHQYATLAFRPTLASPPNIKIYFKNQATRRTSSALAFHRPHKYSFIGRPRQIVVFGAHAMRDTHEGVPNGIISAWLRCFFLASAPIGAAINWFVHVSTHTQDTRCHD